MSRCSFSDLAILGLAASLLAMPPLVLAGTLVGKPGDMVYFPKGAQVTYSTPARVKLACVNCIL